jgi:sorbitol-specific phosphotransferase system component IIBC
MVWVGWRQRAGKMSTIFCVGMVFGDFMGSWYKAIRESIGMQKSIIKFLCFFKICANAANRTKRTFWTWGKM